MGSNRMVQGAALEAAFKNKQESDQGLTQMYGWWNYARFALFVLAKLCNYFEQFSLQKTYFKNNSSRSWNKSKVGSEVNAKQKVQSMRLSTT